MSDGKTKQFKGGEDHGRTYFDAYVAVFGSAGNETVIGAPTLSKLKLQWNLLTEFPLDETRVQHVRMIKVPQGHAVAMEVSE